MQKTMKKSTKLKREIRKLEQLRDKQDVQIDDVVLKKNRTTLDGELINLYLSYREDLCLEIDLLLKELSNEN
tara:strand:- start:364 stop:579 length:216 start_codon:yes stop_codon:yes gene_type:complete